MYRLKVTSTENNSSGNGLNSSDKTDLALSGSCLDKLNKLALNLPLVDMNGWTHTNS